MFSAPDSTALAHSDARAIRRFPLHGREFAQGSAVLRPHHDHDDASEIPARLHVLATGMCG